MKYELALTWGFWLSMIGSLAWFFISQVRKKNARKRAMAAVYERKEHVYVQPMPVGMGVRLSRIPLPPPESRGFFNAELGEPFEWVADKEDMDGHA